MHMRVNAIASVLLVAIMSALAKQPPQRIVSTVPAFTEMLFAVGAGHQVVGITSFCVFPPEAARIEKVGGYSDFSFEKLLSLKPDLVVIGDYSQTLRQKCEAANLSALSLKTATVEDILAAIGQIGSVTGHASGATNVVDTIKAKLDHIRHPNSQKPPRRTLILIGRRIGSFQGLLAVGHGSFLDQLLTIAGGSNVFADVGQPWPQIGIETVLSRKPETIIELIDERSPTGITDQEVAQRKTDWKRFDNIPAVQHERVHILRNDHALIPGPRIAETAEGLAELLR